jgi:hypothetical protein
MHLLRAWRLGTGWREALARRAAARAHLGSSPPRLALDPRLGYRLLQASELPGLERMVALAARVRADSATELDALLRTRGGKQRIVFDLLSDESLRAHPELVEFALCDALLDAAIDYLGTVPVLRRVGLGVSVADPRWAGPAHSQLHHFDGEDFRQLKLLVNVSDVGPEDGPFSFLSAEASARVVRGARMGVRARVRRQLHGGPTSTPRFLDDEVARCTAHDELVQLVGPPGSAVLIDTSRCLHFGSRIGPGRERLVLGFVYQRYHALNESPSNAFDAGPYAGDPVRRMALRPRRPCAMGTHFPAHARARAGTQEAR